tara:strand:+ start:7623 stop:8579 length:957 start_codon:yes stop_codon:yes gene_type:complete
MSKSKFKLNFKTVVPKHDFINENYDNKINGDCKLKVLYFLISTPRSGSTWLCSEIFKKYGIVIHEYLQVSQYIVHFAIRSNILNYDGGKCYKLDFENYVKFLCKRRAKNGVLGINVHISHLPLALKLQQSIININPSVKIISHFLTRKNKISQSISYAKASNSRIWSKVNSVSDFNKITKNPFNLFLRSIQEFNLAPLASTKYKYLKEQEKFYLNNSPITPHSEIFYYESLSQDKDEFNRVLEIIAIDLNLNTISKVKDKVSFLKTGAEPTSILIFLIKNYGYFLRKIYRYKKVFIKKMDLILKKKENDIFFLEIYFS